MTTKYLLQLLFKAFAFSFALAFTLGSIYYIVTVSMAAYTQALSPLIYGTLFLEMILTLMAFAILLLANTSIYNNKLLRLLVFFGGSVVFLVFVLTKEMSHSDKMFYGITGISFFLVQCVLYYKMMKRYPVERIG